MDILYFASLVWLFILIFKGHNWARFYILIYFIVLSPQFIYFLTTLKMSLNSILQISFTVFLQVLGLLLLFSSESSNWFKQVKQRRNIKKIVSRKYKITSTMFYIALGISCLHSIIIAEYSSAVDIFFYNLIRVNNFSLIVPFTINILFIIAIGKGSRLAGSIFLVFIVFTESILGSTLFGYYVSPLFSIWNILILIQVIAFIILFQLDIVCFYNKLTKKHKNVLSE